MKALACDRVNELMGVLYAALSFADGNAPDWPRIAELFSQHARVIRLMPEAVDCVDFTQFRGQAQAWMETSAVTSFCARELAQRAERYGDIIQIASAYEASAPGFVQHGVSSLQWIREHNSWKIISVCWQAESDERSVAMARASLSAREREILTFAAVGHTNKEIAHALGISHSTVRVLLARAAKKLNVCDRQSAVRHFTSHAAVNEPWQSQAALRSAT